MKYTSLPLLSSASLALLGGFFSAAPGVALAQHTPDPANGEAIYQHWCSYCHEPGDDMPGTLSLRVKYGGDIPAVLLERDDLTAEAIKVFVRQGVQSMPPFRKTEISANELEDLAAYMTSQ